MLCLKGIINRLSFFAVLLSFLVLSGCGDGGSSSADSSASSSSSNAPVPSYAELLGGTLTWNFSIRGTADQPQVYRSHLAARSIGFVQNGDTRGANVLAGGTFAEDRYAPAVVTARQGRISLHSRTTGQSRIVTNLRKDQPVCIIRGYADEDLSGGLINLVLAGGDGECGGVTADEVSHWVSFDDEGTRSWVARGFSAPQNVLYNDAGEIDVIVAYDLLNATTRIYDRKGGELTRFVGSGYAPWVNLIGLPGVTRDDTFVAVSSNGQLFFTTLASLIAADPTSASLSDLSSSASIRTNFKGQNSLVIDRERGLVFVVDEINRTVESQHDFSGQIADGWTLAEVFFVGSRTYAVLTFGDSPETAQLEVYTAEFGSGVEQQVLAGDFELRSATQSSSHIYVTHSRALPEPEPSASDPQPEYELKTLIGDVDGATFIPDRSTVFSRVWNLAQGGSDLTVIALIADNFWLDRGLESPEVWAVSNLTGRPTNRVVDLVGDCALFDGQYGLADDLSVVTLCSGTPSFNHLNLNYGTFNQVTPYYRPIF